MDIQEEGPGNCPGLFFCRARQGEDLFRPLDALDRQKGVQGIDGDWRRAASITLFCSVRCM